MVPRENRVAAGRWSGELGRLRYVGEAAAVQYDLLTFTAQFPAGEVRKQHFKIFRSTPELLNTRAGNVSLHFRRKNDYSLKRLFTEKLTYIHSLRVIILCRHYRNTNYEIFSAINGRSFGNDMEQTGSNGTGYLDISVTE